MHKKHLFAAFRVLFLSLIMLPARADKGMWLPFLLKEIEGEMQKAGLRLSADDIYSINKSSLKDAVVRFGGGCTGEIVSNQGLLFTNHHCGYGQLARHSTVENDRLTNGFWAMTRQEELPCAGLSVTFVVRMEDVTRQVLDGIAGEVGTFERDEAINQRIKELEAKAVAGTNYKAQIKPYYYGAEFYMTVTETFNDVRLVGSPPEAIGKFGGDTDNWMWPRHTGDFMVFRIYADKNNNPANYSPDNVPYTPKHHFPISLKGIKEGDFTMVFGFPGRTEQYLPPQAVKNLSEKIDPLRVGIRAERLAIMARGMEKSPAVRLKYASEYASVANYWKKWDGEMKGIKLMNGVEEKKKEEKIFSDWLTKQYGNDEAASAMQTMADAYKYWLPNDLATTVINEAIMNIAPIDLIDEAQKDLKSKNIDGLIKLARARFSQWDPTIERENMAAMLKVVLRDTTIAPLGLIGIVIQQSSGGELDRWTERVWANSVLTDSARFIAAMTKAIGGDAAALETDPIYNLYLKVVGHYQETIAPVMSKMQTTMQRIQYEYVRGLRAAQPNVRFFPDANGTLRLTYGKVEPYKAFDGKTYPVFTDLDGVMKKENPNNKEFIVPARLKELYQKKDYGRYAVNGSVPVAFIASNHTTGGNSGSPLLNADGHLVGINFDRNWEGTKSDVLYDRTQCRNISVDVRFVLFIIDKYARATHLLDEMTLVN